MKKSCAAVTDTVRTGQMLMNLAVVLVIVSAIGAVVFSQVQLTELTDEINTTNEAFAGKKHCRSA